MGACLARKLWLWPSRRLFNVVLIVVVLGVERVVGDRVFFHENWRYEANTSRHILQGGNLSFFGFVGAFDSSLSLSVYHMIDDEREVLFWTVGNNLTLYKNATLVARKQEPAFTLELDNGMGNIVWKSIGGVVGMELLPKSGNLVFYNNSSSVIWDSFSHPTNTLVKTQRILKSTTLYSNSRLFSSTLYKGGLVSFVHVPHPVPYWFCALNQSFDNGNSSFDKRDIRVVFLPPCLGGSDFVMELPSTENQSMPGFTLFSSPCGSVKLAFYVGQNVLPADYMVLDDDGYFKGYSLLQGNSIVPFQRTIPGGVISFPFSPISNYIREPLYPCDVPNACKPYGICTPGPQLSCRCPSSLDDPKATQVFQQLHPEDPSQGCQLNLDPSSLSNSNTSNKPTFLEIKNTTFISLLISGWNYTKLSLIDCLHLCKSNCSCLAIFYQHNTSLCLPVGKVLSLLNMSDSNYSTYLKVYPNPSSNQLVLPLAISLSIVFVLILCAIAVWHRFWLSTKSEAINANTEKLDEEELHQIMVNLPTKFSYNELDMATKAFAKRLGTGGFGSVYEGDLIDGRKVAVKKLEIISGWGHGQGQKEFLAEVATIGRVDHINIVHLVGFCLENSNRMLVYEYMEKGSLDKWLHPTNHQSSHIFLLGWETRLNVALGVARGLAYLHEECSEPILHLDIKPHNILLDSNFVPKLSDFGMSRSIDRDSSRVITRARGTPGYIAPELLLCSTVTRNCDVYSFGIVLLEIVTGRKPVYNHHHHQEGEDDDDEKEGDWYLPTWVARKVEEGKTVDIVDRRLEAGAYNVDEAIEVVKMAFWCIQEDPSKRPAMGLVVKLLQQKGINGDNNMQYPPLAFKRFPYIFQQAATEIDISSSSTPLVQSYSSSLFSAR